MKQKFIITLSIILVATIIFFACSDEELPKLTSINKIELNISEDSISHIFVDIKCDLNQNPKFEIEQYGFCWDTVANVAIENESHSIENLSSQSFVETIENLLPNKIYYVKAYIQNGDVIIYSNELTIKTLDARPVVTTTDITNILANSAQAGGEVEAYETLFPITQRGVCWAKTQNPTITDSLTINVTGNSTFTNQLQNLDIGANYYVKAYALSNDEVFYGEEKSFTTLDGIPEFSMDSLNNITYRSVILFGKIIDNGGLNIQEKGFCLDMYQNPTVDNSVYINYENNLSSFNKEVTGLLAGTKYYTRLFVKNSEGTFYSNELSFSTTTAPLIDYDENMYQTVQIGDQVWMAENLRTTHYADGTEILLAQSNLDWDVLGESEKIYCYYDNLTSNRETYGALYNHKAAMNGSPASNTNPSEVQGACPNGWHLPSDEEWKELEMDLGMTQDQVDQINWRGTHEGNKLKSVDGWEYNIGTNSTGFNALPGGYRFNDNLFYDLGTNASFWSATESGDYVWMRRLSSTNSDIGRNSTDKISGLSIRCVKD